MSDFMTEVTEEITRRKKMKQAQVELYPLISKLSDSALETRGVMLAISNKFGVDPDHLWKWIMKQIED